MKATRFKALPLFWKLLVPYVGLLLIVGTLGAFVITRDLSSRARAALNEQLLQASFRAKALLHEDELYLLESANLSANLEGVAAAIKDRDARAADELMASVRALKKELHLLAITTSDGEGLVEYHRRSSEVPLRRRGTSSSWRRFGFVAGALVDRTGQKAAGIVTLGDRRMLAIAAPVCSGTTECDPIGVAITGISFERLAQHAAGSAERRGSVGLRLFDASAAVLATQGIVPRNTAPVRLREDELLRRSESIGSTDVETLYSALVFQERPIGMIGLTLPSAPAFASVRGAGVRLIAILMIALAGIVAVGALLSRFILAQTRPLLETNRALGEGDLSARAPIVTDDELGQLARGLNQMAEQLQASYETLELRVDQRTDEVQRLLRERTEFFASLSHELRTPIALLISYGEMLVDPDFRNTPRTIAQRGSVIRDTAKQLLAVVNDILDLARLEVGSVRVEIREASLASIIAELRPTLQGLASAGGVTLRIDVPPSLPSVLADPARLRDVIVNLADNATKYTPPRGTVTITAAVTDGDEIALSVADTGVGIPAEARRHIFEPFFQVPATHPQRGGFSTGLGLAIAKRLVEAQAGRIEVESEPGLGTVFTVTLSASRASAAPLRSVKQNASTLGRRARGDAGRPPAQGRVS